MTTTYKYRLIITILLVLLAIAFNGMACPPSDSGKTEQLQKLFQASAKPQTNHNVYLAKSTNELEATSALLYTVYKNYISTQDMGSCVFHPSCSTYAIEALQNKNPIEAYLKIFDRLTRCHTFSSPGQYKPYKNTGLLYDPI